MTTGDPQPASLIPAADGVGVRVGDAEVVFTGQVGGSLKTAGGAFELRAEVKKGRYE